jgi:erythromycin esterase
MHKSGFHRLFFVLFFLFLLALLVIAPQTALPAHGQTLGSSAVARWIQHNALPLRTSDPGGADSDLAPLKRAVANASIVGLGEATHGTHEFITMKTRLAEFLMGTLGYTTFVMENDWGSSQLVDAYINGQTGDISSVMSDGLFASWQTQEYRSLLEWMRAYNADPAHTTKIHFLGMDFQDLSQREFDAVTGYLQQVDPRQFARIQELYAPIQAMSGSTTSDSFTPLAASDQQRFQNQAQEVYDLLRANRQRYLKHSSEQSFALALQNARIIAQFATYSNAQTEAESLHRYYQRDTFMAENVAWIHDHAAGSNPRMLVWAHNVHIANDTAYNSQDGRNLGGELRARYHGGYLAIGTTLYQGSFRSYTYPDSSIQTLTTPASNTYNAVLGQAGLPLYMLDLDSLASGPVKNWALHPAILLNYGLGGEDLSTSAPLSRSFNIIIHIQNTTPSRHL